MFAVPVEVTPATASLSVDIAANASSPGWSTLPSLVVTEKNNNPGKASISGSGTFILNAPTGFVFNTNSVVSTSFSGGDLSSVSATVTSPTTVTVNLTVSGTANRDSFTVSGIEARPISGTTLTSGSITRTGTASVDGATTLGTLTKVAGVAASLEIATQPSSTANSGEPFAQQPVIELHDQFDHLSVRDTNSLVTVVSDAGALLGTTAITAVNGVAAYTNLAATAIGTNILQFSSGALASVFSTPIEVVAGPPVAAALVITTQPSTNATAGVQFAQQPVIAVYDQYGNAFTNDNVSVVTAAVATGSGVLQGTVTATVVEGVATFTNLYHNVAGDITIGFTSGTFSNAVSGTVSVAPAQATNVVFTTQPGNALVGLPFGTQPVIQTVDAFGNPSTVGLGEVVDLNVSLITDGTGSLSGTTNANIGTTGANGTVTFTDLEISAAAPNNQLVATVTGFTTVTSDVFAVTSVVPTQIVIVTQPSSNAVAGVVFEQQPVLNLVDTNGNLAMDDNSTVVTVTASSGALQGTLQATATNGVVTFTDLSRALAGTITLNFSAPNLTGATSEVITVSAAPATTLAFTTSPGVARVGSPFGVQPVVVTRDEFGNPSTVGLAGDQIVDVSLTSGTGTLLGTTSANIGTNGGNGSIQFTDLQIDVAGTGKQLTATNDLLASATSATFWVGGVIPADAIVPVDTSISGSVNLNGPVYLEAASGDVGVGTITLTPPAGFEFVFGNQAPRVQIHRLAGSSAGSINGVSNGSPIDITSYSATNVTYTITQASSGGTINSITWSKIGVRALSGVVTSGDITHTGTATLAAVTNGVTSFGHLQSVAGQFATLAIITQPSSTANAGVVFAQQPVLQLQDQFGNALTNDNTTVVTATANGSNTLVGTTIVTATNGVVTFTDLAYNTSETITITFTAGAASVTSNPIVVGAGAVTALVFTTEPATAVVGLPFTTYPVVQTVDQFGNPSTFNLPGTLPVLLTLTSGTGPLTGTVILDIGTNAGNGTVTFSNLQINTAGVSNQLTASAPELTNAVSAYFTVVAADHLEYVQGDGQTAVAGNAVAINPTVRVVDAQSNAVAGATVTFTVQSGGGSVSQTTVVTDENGLASTVFTLGGVLGDSNQVLTASATVPGTPASITFYATATVGQAAQLGIATQPSATATAGEVFAQQPVIRIEDAFGNLIADDNTTVVTVGINTGTGALNGVLTATATNGIATFTNLSYNVAETIDLVFTSGALTNVVSNPIVVSPAVVAGLAFTTQPGDAYTDEILNPQPVVKSQDEFGNDSTNGLAQSLIVSVELTSGTGELLGTTNIDIGLGASAGVATFTNLQVTFGGLDKQLTASADGLTDATSDTFRIGGVEPGTAPIAPANGSSVALTGPAYYELNSGDVGVGTVVLNAPAGFEFDTNSAAVVRVTRISGNGSPANNINGANNGKNGTEYPVTVTPTQITFTVTSPSTNGVTDLLTWEGILVKLGVGAVSVPSEITKTGTSVMEAVVDGVTSFGTLTGEARPSVIIITTQPSSTATVGVQFAQQPVVRVEDQFGNLWTNSSVTITAVRNAGEGTLQGTLSVQTVNGIATFTDLSHDTVSTITINFTGVNLATATSGSIVVTPVGGKLDQTITFAPLTDKNVNDSPFTVSATASSGLPVTFIIVSGPATITNNTITLTGAEGTVVVRASQAGDATYNAAPDVDRSFQVTAQGKLNQTITFAPLTDKNVNDGPFTVSATASSGLPVTFSIVSGPATITNNTITLTGAEGTVVVRASQAGDGTYNAAPDVDRSFQVTAQGKLNQVITFAPLPDRTFGDAPFTVNATASSGLPVTFSIVSGDATISNNVVTITGIGPVVIRASQGGDATYNAAPNVDREFNVNPSPVGTVKSDLNGDLKTDIWFQNGTRVIVWLMNGLQFDRGVAVSGQYSSLAWKVVGQADFNDDKRQDIVWQHTDGRMAVWYMNGTQRDSIAAIRAIGSGWKAVAVSDMNGDSSPDIVFQAADGRVAVRNMQGTNVVGINVYTQPNSAGWRVAAAGDMDHDSIGDLLVQHTNGVVAVWKGQNRSFVTSNGGHVPTATFGAFGEVLPVNGGRAIVWDVVGLGDLNQDQNLDILLLNPDGRLAVWTMDGTTKIGRADIRPDRRVTNATVVGPR